jgi:3-mercaptopyruvate sulfurtransferase SseA
MKNPGHSGSEAAAQMLRQTGYTVQYLEGGFPAWMSAGYEVDDGNSDSAKFIGAGIDSPSS